MPSQIAHALFAVETVQNYLSTDSARTVLTDNLAYLYLGAQGPDLFLHSVRRKPRAVYYGTILHRKGNAAFADEFASHIGSDWNLFAYLLGWLSHISLDRHVHPYVNYHAGWHNAPDRHADRRYMHVFLEKCMDVQILRWRRGVALGAFPFYSIFAHLQQMPDELEKALLPALRVSVRPARTDTDVRQRIRNAYLDMVGYYAFVNETPLRYFVKARKRELQGEFSARWLASVSPLSEWMHFDTLNTTHHWWHHPCPEQRETNASVPDLWYAALRDSRSMVREAAHVFARTGVNRLYDAVGTRNLNDGLESEHTCDRKFVGPLPLVAMYNRIKAALDREIAVE